MKRGFSQNPDIDREILIRLNYTEIFALCIPPVNSYFNRICNGNFCRNVIHRKCSYLLNYKPKDITYKRYFVQIVKNIIKFLEILGFEHFHRCIFEMFKMEIHRPYFTYFPESFIYRSSFDLKRYYKGDPYGSCFEFLEMIEVSDHPFMKKIFEEMKTITYNTIVTADMIIKIKIIYEKIINNNHSDYFQILKSFQEEFVPLKELRVNDIHCVNHEILIDKIRTTEKIVDNFLVNL